MSASPQKAQPDSKLDFRDWPEVLAAAALPERIRESYAITLRWYLSWCRRGRVAVDHTSARRFIDWTVEQKQPEAWKLEQWKEALRWFFRAGRACRLPEPPAAASEPVQAGPPELAESRPQEGSGPAVTWSDWIESARRLLRIRHMSYRTEQSYLDWARRFVRRYRDRPPGEVRRLLGQMEGTTRLMARVMYGTGLRLMELIRLRVQEVDFGRGLILVRRGKGDKDRVTMLP